jgi:putative DNA primase/helicase
MPDSRPASSTDTSTWNNFAAAWRAYDGGGFSGIGFVFAKGGGVVGVDLDEVFDESGELRLQARRIVEKFDTYVEFSPSKRGLHLICCGSLEKGMRRGPYYRHDDLKKWVAGLSAREMVS